ncbi:LLM class flavin-dependent oxidoreductase [Roseiarcaceae bacterium H3SJ34-1]|uniref:LLM class flavin-dependent oxidoreductase n=1 Tax=Terripilifer ovatus TaxID=3032367 RepID=UPI003AB99199|nr:LLM class flavin-dependent oxidoreductase [Roseiarcaceae bacterium H3SJ34-1]
MEFGLQFFPSIGPDEKSARDYFAESLRLVDEADDLGYKSLRIVEHYFRPYGGYSPNPIVFLAAAAMRSRKAQLLTGAVLPVFNNPMKLAGEIGMLDAISGGRLEVGFARAFLPHEFAKFGINVNESRARFDEGIEQIRLLLENETVSHAGRFHTIDNVSSLPRPTQTPRPPFWVAALATAETFEFAGRMGYGVMGIPLGGAQLRSLMQTYREAWRAAGHPGKGRVMLAFHMYCHESREAAADIAREPINKYLQAVVSSASEWEGELNSKDYPNYDKIIAALRAETFETQLTKGCIWVGNPKDIREQIADYVGVVGDFEIASLQANFHNLPYDLASASARLFSREVMPHFS